MPLKLEGNRLRGPGVFDMKGGLTQIIFAQRILKRLGLEPEVTPVVLINSDEEIGSPESKGAIEVAAKGAVRAFVPEPGMGLEGRGKDGSQRLGPIHHHGDRKGSPRWPGSQRGGQRHPGDVPPRPGPPRYDGSGPGSDGQRGGHFRRHPGQRYRSLRQVRGGCSGPLVGGW